MSVGTPPVTVAMITYNHERYVAAAISSILGQTYRQFELVIVDDGSTDGTREVIHDFRDERIRYVRQDNQGPSAARNTAVREAHGDFIAQMSGDDIAEPDRLARQVAVLDGRKDRVLFTDIAVIDEDGHPRHDTPDAAAFRRMANRPHTEILHYLFTTANCFSAPTAFAAREVFESAGGYDVLLLQVQDWDMWTRLALRGVILQTVPEPLLRYRIRAAHGNLSAPTDAAVARFFFEVKRMLRAYRGIASVGELRSIFPEVDGLHYPLEDEFTTLYLALLAIRNEGENRVTAFFGGDLLLDLMADTRFRARIGERLAFGLPDLFRILGTTDPWSKRRTESAVEVITRSRSWRLTRPFRSLSALGARLRTRR